MIDNKTSSSIAIAPEKYWKFSMQIIIGNLTSNAPNSYYS